LQETVSILDNKFLIIGIGINIKKSPKIRNYPTPCLDELINKAINKREIEDKLKLIFETNFSKMYKINKKLKE
jgi:BirA family biotin operon repressor/biotin-[acetyl-CoA-carboxylase] ligase